MPLRPDGQSWSSLTNAFLGSHSRNVLRQNFRRGVRSNPDYRSAMHSKRKIALHRKIVYAAAMTLLLLLVLEGALRAIGFKRDGDSDPFVGFSSYEPHFVPVVAGQQKLWGTNRSKKTWFNYQEFARKKPARTRRVFCMGGSTTHGRPYDDKTSFCGWLRVYLNELCNDDGQVEWEVVNAGGVSYASYRVAAMMEELVEYEPDLFIVYSVHNEFLENRTYDAILSRPKWFRNMHDSLSRTSTYAVIERLATALGTGKKSESTAEQLSADVDERLNHTVGPADYTRDPQWQQMVLSHYEFNLRRMVELARSVGAEILFVTPASNELDCSPFKSEISEVTSDAQQDLFFELVDQAVSAEQEEQLDQALLHWAEAVRTDAGHAESQFRLGRALAAEKDYSSAKVALNQAIDQDICPLRATSHINGIVHDVASSLDVPIVDFDKHLHQLSLEELGHDLLGERYFLDHVHPTIDVNRRLALWFMEVMEQAGEIEPIDWETAKRAIEQTTEGVLKSLDQRSHGIALRNLAKVLHWSGKFDEAARCADDAIELLFNDAESRLVLADCLRCTGQLDRSADQFQILFDDFPLYYRGYLPYGELLFEMDELEKAREYLELAVSANPDNQYAKIVLEDLIERSGETEK